jgi:hypothetical protein
MAIIKYCHEKDSRYEEGTTVGNKYKSKKW